MNRERESAGLLGRAGEGATGGMGRSRGETWGGAGEGGGRWA